MSNYMECANGHLMRNDATECNVPDCSSHQAARPLKNQPMQHTNAFGTATQGEFPADYRPDERDRPQVMFLWLWWFIFSPVVLFLAPSYASKAKRLGFKEVARYWVPFWLTLIGYAAIAALVIVAVNSANSYSSSTYHSSYTYTAPTTTAQSYSSRNNSFSYSVTQETGMPLMLADDIVSSGTGIWDSNSSAYATAAVCESNTDTTVEYGYNCNITRNDGNGGSYWVTYAGSTWSAVARTHQ